MILNIDAFLQSICKYVQNFISLLTTLKSVRSKFLYILNNLSNYKIFTWPCLNSLNFNKFKSLYLEYETREFQSPSFKILLNLIGKKQSIYRTYQSLYLAYQH